MDLSRVRDGWNHGSSGPAPIETSGTLARLISRGGTWFKRMDMLACGLWAWAKQPFHVRLDSWDENRAILFLKPGATVWDDPHQLESWNHYGKKNRYYYQFRRLAGVVSESDFPGIHAGRVGKCLRALEQGGFVERYRDRPDEFTVREYLSDGHLVCLLEREGLTRADALAFAAKLARFRDQRALGINVIDERHLESLPHVYIGEGELDLREHHRIRGALDFGIAIKVIGIRDKTTFC